MSILKTFGPHEDRTAHTYTNNNHSLTISSETTPRIPTSTLHLAGLNDGV